MGNHPLNLALRFMLELVALFAPGYWGWTQHDGLARLPWTIGLPLVVAVLWGTFRVPGDPGRAPIATPGVLRLLLEAAVFGGATLAFYAAGRDEWGLIFGIVVLLHYAASYDRIGRLLGRAN
jgi:hypothetical protein